MSPDSENRVTKYTMKNNLAYLESSSDELSLATGRKLLFSAF